MKKHIGIILIGVTLIVILLLYSVFFTVRWQEKALVLTFGKISRQVDEPGLNFVWPWQKVVKFDTRIRTLTQQLTQTQTRDKQNVIVSVYINWRISDSNTFYQRFRLGDTVDAEDIMAYAEKTMRTSWIPESANVFAEYNLGQLVTLDTDNFKLRELELGSGGMLNRLRKVSQGEGGYGIEIVDLGIQRLGVPDGVTESVFERMKADRQAEVDRLISEGQSVAVSKTGQADSQRTIILARAQARAKKIMGQGDAEAAKYYAEFLKHPELANFLRRLETLRNTLNHRTTIVLDSASPPFNLLLSGPKVNDPTNVNADEKASD